MSPASRRWSSQFCSLPFSGWLLRWGSYGEPVARGCSWSAPSRLPRMARRKGRRPSSRTSSGTEGPALPGLSGQMSVEAAALLPVLLSLVAFLVQPTCALYTRAVMSATASELARLAMTSRGTAAEQRAFALRRLAAVPDVAIFHTGGERGWDVAVEGPDEGGVVTVAIAGSVRPLPLLGALVAPLGVTEGGEVVLRVETTARMRADWIGGDYGEWVEVWE